MSLLFFPIIVYVYFDEVTLWLHNMEHNLTREWIEYQLEEQSRPSTLRDECWAAQTELHTPASARASNYAQYDRKQKARLHLLLHSTIQHSHLNLHKFPHQLNLTKINNNKKFEYNNISILNSPLGTSSPRYCLINSRTCALLRSYSFASNRSNLWRFSWARLE